MATELAMNAWGIVNHHQQHGILELRWLASTADMADDVCKATLELFADQAERAGAPLLLIDATDFGHRFGEGVMAWRDQQIIPRYNAAGTRKFAFHVPEGFPDAMEAGGQPVIDGPATFPTAVVHAFRHVALGLFSAQELGVAHPGPHPRRDRLRGPDRDGAGARHAVRPALPVAPGDSSCMGVRGCNGARPQQRRRSWTSARACSTRQPTCRG